jgi:oxygen-independent coproporphyrinogen-3 oxidase
VKRVIPVAVAVARSAATGASLPASQLSSPPPLSFYVHFPWCVRKCPYCDFNSHEPRGTIPEAEYITALIADLEAALPQVWGRRVLSVFIGGGTPSLLSVGGVDTLLTALRMRLPIAADAEITLEANPGTVEAEKFAGFRAAGVNRISLGVQSFSDRHLTALGRIHSADEAKRAAELALRHFDNVNFDLMYALPEQTLEEARRDIETAIDFGPTHLSAYHLTLEPNTPFHHAPPPLPDDDLAADMQEMVEATLAAAGFQHYETSAFARPGRRCQHNLNYWNFGDYLGIGAGAHGKLSPHTGIVREMRHKHPQAYLQAAASGNFVQERRMVSAAELPFEFMMNGLRLIDGVPTALYAERTGLQLSELQGPLLAAQREGLLEVPTERIAPTARGQRFLNRLLGMFLA